MSIKKIIFTIIIIFLAVSTNANDKTTHFHFSANDLKHAETALYLTEKGKWQEALYASSILRDDIIKKIILWMKYKSSSSISNYSFAEITEFIKKNNSWPEINTLIENAENSINYSTDRALINFWFTSHKPTTSNGYKHFALLKGDKNNLEIVKTGWIKGSFSEEEEETYYNKFIDILGYNNHLERIEELLYYKRISQAKRMISRLDKPHQILFNYRINLIQNAQLPDLSKISPNLKNNSGLTYDLLNYYDLKKDYVAVRRILKNYFHPHKYGDKVWKIRARQIRELLEERKYQLAYNFSKFHDCKDSNNYSEAEWIAGWIALTFLKDKDIAAFHFNNLYKKVESPISKARGAYWMARSQDYQNKQLAQNWYKKAAIYPETFYGQLSIAELGIESITLNHPPQINSIDLSKYKNNELVKAAFIFMKLQKTDLAYTFLKSALYSAKTPGEIALITEFGAKMDKKYLSVKLAKDATKKGIFITKTAYPNIKYISKLNHTKRALALSIIRQESMFDEYAQSKAGALGLMQIMPGTAKELSKEISLVYSNKRLKSSPEYNIALGSYYLEKLINYFDGSYILAIAAYNAGITNVTKWINAYGDPRQYDNIDQIINWLESIPFYETRNYVQRVIENLQIYRLVADNKTTGVLSIENDLRR